MEVKLINEVITSNYGENLLRARGVFDVKTFLNPDETCLEDWNRLKNVEYGAELIKNLDAAARIGLVVDCDVDGFTSAAIIYQYLLRLYPEISIIPYIHKGKAHGLEEHWQQIQDENYDLVIVPDAGSNDKEYAARLSCPVLVIDHHLVEEEIYAPNMCVINNQTSPDYYNKNLSGAGVAYQFCRALDFFFEKNWADDYIDLAATGVCGDMMSGLEVENQYLWKTGFSKVNNYFLLSLARKQGYSITGKMNPTDKEIIEALDPTSIAFYIVPLINAMVRVGTQEEKERMFLAFVDGHKMIPSQKRGAKGTLEEVAVECARECTNARVHQNKFLDEAVDKVEQKIFKYDLLENQILFVRLEEDDNFPSELNGLIAMRLAAKYRRPTIVARLNDEGYVRGSIRGINNSKLTSFKNYLDSTGLCEYVQGHDNAAGISIPNRSLSELHARANQDLLQYDFGDTYYEVEFVRQAYSDDLTDLIKDLSKLKHVWSQGCGEPLIYVKDIHFTWDDVQIMGKNQNTVKIVKNDVAYMKFFADDMIEELRNIEGDIKLEVVGKANLNTWMGRTTPQIFIEAYEIKEDKVTDF